MPIPSHPLHLTSIEENDIVALSYKGGTCDISGARYPAGVPLRTVRASVDGVSYLGVSPLSLIRLLGLRTVTDGYGYTSPYHRIERLAWADFIDGLGDAVPPGHQLRVIYEGWSRPEVAVYRRLKTGQWAPKQGSEQTTDSIQRHLARTRSGARMFCVVAPK